MAGITKDMIVGLFRVEDQQYGWRSSGLVLVDFTKQYCSFVNLSHKALSEMHMNMANNYTLFIKYVIFKLTGPDPEA